MPVLASDLRRQLESVCVQARDKAEEAARSALKKRAVDVAEPHSHFTPAEKESRNRLRARGRQAGDVRLANKTQSIDQLTQELAYEYWHRMLFARFLAENQLLMHPDGVAVSLEECDALAQSEGALNGFALAGRYASKMLPQIFRTDDVLLEIEFAPEQRLALEKLLAILPQETFLADDSLGWVYQFWQTAEKDRVNKAGDKIDGHTLPAVTQLFTEHYMVEFLLHNTIGAWWCGRHRIKGPPGGAGIPAGQSPVEMPYLRWRDDGMPAAGTFDGWPKTLAEFTILDPCCGSGHFLVAAFNLLVPLRKQDEGLSAQEACNSVLRENLFGLELDPRCTQIAAFALALAAWKYAEAGGYRSLHSLNIACSGIGPQAKREDWVKLADGYSGRQGGLGREAIANGLEILHELFSLAPTLGSLINPHELRSDLITADYETLLPMLEEALSAEHDSERHESAVAAAGMAKAAKLLAGEYTLVCTNVPYLGRGKQDEVLANYLAEYHANARADLATGFVSRAIDWLAAGGSLAVVTPQNWLFLGQYKKFREATLKSLSWNSVARLGARAFETISGEVVNVALLIHEHQRPADSHSFLGLDVSQELDAAAKRKALLAEPISIVNQLSQLKNPDSRIIQREGGSALGLLSEIAVAYQGLVTGDRNSFIFQFWEIPALTKDWETFADGYSGSEAVLGRENIILWQGERGRLYQLADENRDRLHDMHESGNLCWGKRGVLLTRIGLRATPYYGERFDNNLICIVPHDSKDIQSLWTYCCSSDYRDAVRELDQKFSLTNATACKVAVSLDDWSGNGGFPKAYSSDPTQWLFDGHPRNSTSPLQVAVARLLAYNWPRKTGSSFPDCPSLGTDDLDALVDDDGIVCIPSVRGEPAAAERLSEVLRTAFGKDWSEALLHKLLTDAGCKAGTALDEWLRSLFFEQHCKLFHNRPFIWHIWDGRKDGFSVLVNYHKLTHKGLENLTYSYLGDWIKAQAADAKAGKTGADLRLDAAQKLQEKLKHLLAGEPDYDIFVRWKPLHEQAIGWHPDLNDGVRMNIRPFMKADVLRKKPNIKWTKDRGKEPDRDKDEYPWFWKAKEFVGDRVNDVHLTNAQKRSAREAKGMK